MPSAGHVFRLADLVQITARRHPHQVAIVHDRGTLTFARFRERTLRCAQALLGLGLKTGDGVVLFARNGPEYLELYIALQLAGLVAIPVNYRLSPAELVYVLDNSGARGLVIDDAFTHVYAAARGKSATSLHALVILNGEVSEPMAYETLLAQADAIEPVVTTTPYSPAAIFYTSGTTGFPKGAVMSHMTVLMRFCSWGWRFGITEEDVLLVTGPQFHQSFGSISLLSLCVGAKLVLHTDFEAARVTSCISRDGITWSFMVPKMLSAVLESAASGTPVGDCRALRGLMSSGSTLPTPVLRGLIDAFPTTRLADAYGWTESGWITYCRHEDMLGESRTVGKSSYGCELAILDDDGNLLPPGAVGQIYATNPVAFLGYHDNPEATADMRRGKWETGGDVGMLDDAGFLYLYDRRRDMIVSGGENIYPAEIERVLAEHPTVLEVAVVGVPDDSWGESPRACVVFKSGMAATDEELLGFCADKLARFKHPKSIYHFEALPRNSMGKVLRRELRERFWNEGKTACDLIGSS
jgi:acyl-CoA synthetase (AMP-forming)/AMP-acid ligase II